MFRRPMALDCLQDGKLKNRQIAVGKPLVTQEVDLANLSEKLAVLLPQPGPLGVLANVARKRRELTVFLHDPIVPIAREDRRQLARRGGRGNVVRRGGQHNTQIARGPALHLSAVREVPSAQGLPVNRRQRLHQLVNVLAERQLVARVFDVDQ